MIVCIPRKCPTLILRNSQRRGGRINALRKGGRWLGDAISEGVWKYCIIHLMEMTSLIRENSEMLICAE